MTFVPRTAREKHLYASLRAATVGRRSIASPCNYSVYDGENELESGMSHDEAIGFAKGLEAAGMSYGGHLRTPTARCGAFIVYPEDRYGEIVGMPEEDT